MFHKRGEGFELVDFIHRQAFGVFRQGYFNRSGIVALGHHKAWDRVDVAILCQNAARVQTVLPRDLFEPVKGFAHEQGLQDAKRTNAGHQIDAVFRPLFAYVQWGNGEVV